MKKRRIYTNIHTTTTNERDHELERNKGLIYVESMGGRKGKEKKIIELHFNLKKIKKFKN